MDEDRLLISVDSNVASPSVPILSGNDTLPSNVAEDVEIVAEQTVRKRKLCSAVWNDFEKCRTEDGRDLATCLHCKKVFDGASSKGTTHLRNHVQRCPKRFHGDVKQQMLTTTKAANELNARVVNFKFDHERSRQDLAKMIIKHELPFTFVEYEYFGIFLSNIQPQFKPCSRATIRNEMMKIYEEEKDKLFTVLDKLDSRIGLTTDLWTSGQTMGYACLTAHFIDDQWELQKKILAFEYVPSPHTADVLFKVVKTQILNWNVDKKLCAITMDNASSNNAMVRELRSWLCEKNSLVCHGRYFHIQCSAHILNLIVHDGLNVISKFIEKVRKSVLYCRKTPKKKEAFKTALLHEHLCTSKGLCLDVPTRWNSTYLMLQTAIELKRGFLRLAEIDPDYTDCPLFVDWEIASNVCDCLKVFYNATLTLSGTRYVTANLYFSDVCAVHIKLHEWLNNEHEYIREMASAMLLKFRKYWEECSVIFTIACILDPRWKLDYVIYTYQKIYGEAADMYIEKIRSFLYELYAEYAMNMSAYVLSSTLETTSTPSQAKCNDTANELKGGFRKLISHKTSISYQKTELDVYLEEIQSPDDLGFDVLAWWKFNGNKFSILSKIARDIFAIPVTSVASESAFSTGSRVIDDNRSSLLPDTIQALICTQDWLPSQKSKDRSPIIL